MSNNTPTEQMIKKNPAKKVLHRLSLRYVSSTWKALEGYYQVEMNTGARVRQGSLFVMFAPPPPPPPATRFKPEDSVCWESQSSLSPSKSRQALS